METFLAILFWCGNNLYLTSIVILTAGLMLCKPCKTFPFKIVIVSIAVANFAPGLLLSDTPKEVVKSILLYGIPCFAVWAYWEIKKEWTKVWKRIDKSYNT